MPNPAVEEKQLKNRAGLYIHLPFCLGKCAYCAFNSVAVAGQDTDGYLRDLHVQLRRLAAHPLVAPHHFSTIFIGGGTPTIYAAEQLAGLVRAALNHFQFAPQPEITIESNPNSISLKSLTALRRAGVNRLSIGIQSFSDRLLARLGRSHNAIQAGQAINTAREAGFADINLDLMYGLPGQSREDWRHTLETACRYGTEHLAVYELTIEEKTPFGDMAAAGKLKLPNEDEVADMGALARRHLPEAGFIRYEIANFARPGYQCRHNINYWENGSYLGLGAGAVSYMAGVRISNISAPALFSEDIKTGNDGFSHAECLCREKRFRETVIMGLRMIDGISLSSLEKCFNIGPRQYYGSTFRKLLAANLLEIKDDFLRIPSQAMAVANQILSELV